MPNELASPGSWRCTARAASAGVPAGSERARGKRPQDVLLRASPAVEGQAARRSMSDNCHGCCECGRDPVVEPRNGCGAVGVPGLDEVGVLGSMAQVGRSRRVFEQRLQVSRDRVRPSLGGRSRIRGHSPAAAVTTAATRVHEPPWQLHGTKCVWAGPKNGRFVRITRHPRCRPLRSGRPCWRNAMPASPPTGTWSGCSRRRSRRAWKRGLRSAPSWLEDLDPDE